MRKAVSEIAQTFLLLVVLCLGAEMPKSQAKATQTLVSHGNLIYEDARGSVSLYAADILLLEEKLSSVPERCFDPVCYAHTHNWEYRSINERTHTRHCAECGDTNDLTDVHRAVRTQSDTILHEGKSYPGRCFICACGYQWRMELTHTMTYEVVDAVSHRGRCELDTTAYCRGYEPSVEEHYAWYYEMGEDDLHHVKICFDCEYRVEEACRFEEAEGDENLCVCVCGRSTAREEESEAPETDEPPETPETPETDEPPETPNTPETGEPPETDEPSETPEPPETDEPSEAPETSEAPENVETPDK